jgi:hypothetical protein
MGNVLLIIWLLAAGPASDRRLDTLRSQFERLHSITVAPEARPQAEAALKELGGLLTTRPASDEEVDRIYQRMDDVRSWLLAHAAEKPSPGNGEFLETTTLWTVKNEQLAVALSKKDLAMTVTTAGGTWQWQPSDEKDVELGDGRSFALSSARKRKAEAFHTGFSAGMSLSLSDFAAAPALGLAVLVHLIGPEAVFEIVLVDDIPNLSTLAFPKALQTGNAETDVAVIPRMQGILVPGNWPQEIRARELVNSRALYMPWWGQIANGRGVQTIFDTSDDAGAEYVHPAGGPTRIQPLWYSSLNRLRYPRMVRYVFDDQSTYVRMARRYRRYVQEMGQFVSLAEKRVRTPNLDKVIGRPVIHIGALYHSMKGSRFYKATGMEANHRLETFESLAASLRDLKAKGIDQAYVHLDGWGYRGYDNLHPDVLPPGPEQGGWEGLQQFADTCDELGYLLAVHDQYRDFYLDAASFDDKLTIRDADGSRTEHAEWPGGRQTYLSPRFAPGYVRRNHDAFAEHGINVRGAYLDVFAVVPLEESFQPLHRITRTDCARYRRECFDLLRARGYVVSSEEPADYLVRSLDMVHHGPYSVGPKGYGAGEAVGIPVPLFNLVYHDSILLPWAMTDNGGWGIPNGDAGWLHCVLNAGLPYLSPGAGPGQIARVREVCGLALRLNLLDMTDHRFLDRYRRIQQTAFSDGTRVTVDFEKKTYSVSGPAAP